MAGWRLRGFAAVLLACLSGGCLPESGPGIGQRVLPGRAFANLGAGTGEDRPLFFTVPATPGAPTLDLYLLRPGQVTPELLVHDVAGSAVVDALGRVYVRHTPAKDPDSSRGGANDDFFLYQLRQIDLGSGVSREFGTITGLKVSPGATHLVLSRPDRRVDSLTLDGVLRSLPVESPGTERFVGEDVCWIESRRLDCALAEGGPPVHPTDQSVLKLLLLPSSDGKPDVLIVTVDPASRPPVEFLRFWRVHMRPRPGQPREVLLGRGRPLGDVIVAGDSEWFAFVDLPPAGGDPRLRLMSAGAPTEVTMTVAPGPSDYEDERTESFGWSDPRFRPGHGEIWSLGPGGKVAILRTDGNQTLHVPPSPVRRAPDLMEWASGRLDFEPSESSTPSTAEPKLRSMFSADGRWWVYREGGRFFLGDASDPTAPGRLPLPSGEAGGVTDLRGLNRLAIWSAVAWQGVQLDLYVADSLSPLGTVDQVRQAVVGARGMLALTTGALLLGGLGAGKPPVVIGPNVSQFALLNGCPGCDPVAAGTQVAYTVRARVPWKYDRVWLGELP